MPRVGGGYAQVIKTEEKGSDVNLATQLLVDAYHDDYEIAVDSVKGLGDFVEIEHFGEAGDKPPEQITKEMVQFLKDIGCGEIKRNYVGYPFLILFPDEVKYDIL